jgi:hypothetical protein
VKFTIDDFKKLNPSEEDLWWYGRNIQSEVFEEVIVKAGKHYMPFALRLLTALPKELNIKLAIFSAREVLHIFEAKYPNDFKPRQAIEAAEKFKDTSTYATSYTLSCSSAEDDADYAAAAAYAAAASTDISFVLPYNASYAAIFAADESLRANTTTLADLNYFKQKVINYAIELVKRTMNDKEDPNAIEIKQLQAQIRIQKKHIKDLKFQVERRDDLLREGYNFEIGRL